MDITNILSYLPSLKDMASCLGKIVSKSPLPNAVKEIMKLANAYLVKSSISERPFFIENPNKELPLVNGFQYKHKYYPLKSISRFSAINILGTVDYAVSSEYTVNINCLKGLASNYLDKWTNHISYLSSKYSTFYCRVNLVDSNKVITVDTTVIKGHLDLLKISYNWDFVKAYSKDGGSEPLLNSVGKNNSGKIYGDIPPKYTTDPFYSPKNTKIMDLTDPTKIGYKTDIRACMQSNSSYQTNPSHINSGITNTQNYCN